MYIYTYEVSLACGASSRSIAPTNQRHQVDTVNTRGTDTYLQVRTRSVPIYFETGASRLEDYWLQMKQMGPFLDWSVKTF